MILTEFNEERLREEEEKIKKEFNFIFLRIVRLALYLLMFLLIIFYVFLLAQKSKLEREYSYNQEILKMINNEIEIYSSIITTYSSVDNIKKKIGVRKFYIPNQIYYIYNQEVIMLIGE